MFFLAPARHLYTSADVHIFGTDGYLHMGSEKGDDNKWKKNNNFKIIESLQTRYIAPAFKAIADVIKDHSLVVSLPELLYQLNGTPSLFLLWSENPYRTEYWERYNFRPVTSPDDLFVCDSMSQDHYIWSNIPMIVFTLCEVALDVEQDYLHFVGTRQNYKHGGQHLGPFLHWNEKYGEGVNDTDEYPLHEWTENAVKFCVQRTNAGPPLIVSLSELIGNLIGCGEGTAEEPALFLGILKKIDLYVSKNYEDIRLAFSQSLKWLENACKVEKVPSPRETADGETSAVAMAEMQPSASNKRKPDDDADGEDSDGKKPAAKRRKKTLADYEQDFSQFLPKGTLGSVFHQTEDLRVMSKALEYNSIELAEKLVRNQMLLSMVRDGSREEVFDQDDGDEAKRLNVKKVKKYVKQIKEYSVPVMNGFSQDCVRWLTKNMIEKTLIRGKREEIRERIPRWQSVPPWGPKGATWQFATAYGFDEMQEYKKEPKKVAARHPTVRRKDPPTVAPPPRGPDARGGGGGNGGSGRGADGGGSAGEGAGNRAASTRGGGSGSQGPGIQGDGDGRNGNDGGQRRGGREPEEPAADGREPEEPAADGREPEEPAADEKSSGGGSRQHQEDYPDPDNGSESDSSSEFVGEFSWECTCSGDGSGYYSFDDQKFPNERISKFQCHHCKSTTVVPYPDYCPCHNPGIVVEELEDGCGTVAISCSNCETPWSQLPSDPTHMYWVPALCPECDNHDLMVRYKGTEEWLYCSKCNLKFQGKEGPDDRLYVRVSPPSTAPSGATDPEETAPSPTPEECPKCGDLKMYFVYDPVLREPRGYNCQNCGKIRLTSGAKKRLALRRREAQKQSRAAKEPQESQVAGPVDDSTADKSHSISSFSDQEVPLVVAVARKSAARSKPDSKPESKPDVNPDSKPAAQPKDHGGKRTAEDHKEKPAGNSHPPSKTGKPKASSTAKSRTGPSPLRRKQSPQREQSDTSPVATKDPYDFHDDDGSQSFDHPVSAKKADPIGQPVRRRTRFSTGHSPGPRPRFDPSPEPPKAAKSKKSAPKRRENTKKQIREQDPRENDRTQRRPQHRTKKAREEDESSYNPAPKQKKTNTRQK